MNRRFSAYQKTRLNTQVGGSYADSSIYSTMFRKSECPVDLGVVDVEVFSKQVNSRLLNKPMTFRAGQNMIELPATASGKIQWSLSLTGVPRATIVDVDANLGSYPGKSGTQFRVALSVPFYHEPALLKTVTTNAPMLRIVGYPQTESVDKHWYTFELQTGDMTAYCPLEDLAIGQTMMDVSSSVADEMNQKYAGLEFGSTSDYGTHISYFARKFEVTDKVIRLELDAMKKKSPFSGASTKDGTYLSSIIGTNYMIAPAGLNEKDPKIIEKGKLISNIEFMLRDKIYMDREMSFYYSQTQVSQDPDTSFQRLNGAGWFQVAREGNYSTHDGQNLTLGDFINRIDSLKFNVEDPKDDVIEIETGTQGMKLVNQLIGLEVGALPFTLSSSYFIDDTVTSDMTAKALGAGHQFTEYTQWGRIYRFVWNPNKDNAQFFQKLDPETNKPLESESFDVFDLGTSKDALGNKKNMALAYDPSAFEWFTVSNVYNFATGSIKDGSNAYSDSKDAKVRMAINGAAVWFDVSRTLRIERL